MLSKAAQQDLKIRCATMVAGQSLRQDTCPTCHGGTYGEKSFSVSVTTRGIEFCCHRASCTERGILTYNRTYNESTPPGMGVELRPFTYPTGILEDWDYDQFEKHYEITSQELLDNNVVKCPSRNSYVFPSYNIIGHEVGKVERWYDWQLDSANHRGPKCFYHKEVDHPKMYVPKTCTIGDKCIVVEDCLSAIKAGRICMSLALLGSSLSNDVLIRLKDTKVKDIVFVLDPDASVKSLEMKKEFALYFENISTVFVPKDPKDMRFEELEVMLCSV